MKMKIESRRIGKKIGYRCKLRTMHVHERRTYVAIEQEASVCKNHDSDCRKPVIAGPISSRLHVFEEWGGGGRERCMKAAGEACSYAYKREPRVSNKRENTGESNVV